MYSPTLAIMLRCAFLCRLFFLLGTVRSFASGAFLPPKVIFPGDTVRILIPSTAANGLQNSASFVRLVARAVGASGSSSTSGSGEDVVLASSTSSSSGNGNLVELEVPSAGALQPFLTSAFSFRFAHLLVGATTATSEALVTVASREILFLETDKAIYKPGEVVRFRAVAMDRVSGKPLSLMPLPAPETSGGALLQAEVEVRKIVSESEQLLIANLRTSPTNSSALFGVFDDAEELQFPLPPTIISIGATTSAEQRQSARDTYSAQAKLLYANATSSQREVLARSNLLSYVVEEYVLPTFSVALALKEEAPTIVSQETEAGAIKGFVSASYTYGGEAKCKNDKILVEVIKKCPVWSSWWGIGPVVWRGGMPEIAFLRRNRKRGRRRGLQLAAGVEELESQNGGADDDREKYDVDVEDESEEGEELEQEHYLASILAPSAAAAEEEKLARRRLSSPAPYGFSSCVDTLLTTVEVDIGASSGSVAAVSAAAGASSSPRYEFSVDLDTAIPDRTAAAASLREVLRLERERGNVDAIRLVANCTDIASGETRSSDSIEIKYASTAVRVTSDPEFQPGLPFHVLVEDLTAFVKTSVEGYHSGAAAAAAGGADVKLVVESSHYHHSVQPRYVEIDLAPFLDEVASSGTATSSRKLKTLESKLFTVPLPPERDASCCDLSALSAASGDLYAWSTEKIRCCVQSVRAYVTVDGVQVTTAAAARSGAANAREDSHTACATRKYSLRGHYATAGKLVSTGGSSGAAVPQADSYVIHFRTTLPQVAAVNVVLIAAEDGVPASSSGNHSSVLYPVNLAPARVFASAQNASCCQESPLRQVTESVTVHQRPESSYGYSYYDQTPGGGTTTTTTTTRAAATLESVTYYVGSVNITDVVLSSVAANTVASTNYFTRPGSRFFAVVTLLGAALGGTTTAKASDSVRFEVSETSALLTGAANFGRLNTSWMVSSEQNNRSFEIVTPTTSVLPGASAYLSIASSGSTEDTSETHQGNPPARLFFSAQDRAVSLLTADSNLLSGSVVATHRTTTSGGIMAASSTSSSLGATSSSSAMMCREFYDEARIFDQLGALRADSLSGAAVPLSACAPILPTGYCPTSSSSSPYTRSGNDMAVTMDVAVMESAAAPTMAAGASASAGAGTTSGGAEQAADVLSVAAQSKLRTFFPETWLWRGVDVLDAATASAAADDALSSLTDSQSQSQSAASSSNSSLLRATVPDSLTAWDLRGFAVHPVVGLGTDVSLPSLTVAKPVVAGVRAPYVITRGEMVALRGSVAAHLRGVAGDDSENGDVSADLECTWRIGVSAGLRFEDPLNKYNTVGVGLPSPSATGEVDDDNYGAGKIVQSYELKAAKTVAKTGAIAFALPVSTSAGRTSVLKPSKVRLEAYCALKAAGGSGSSSFSSVIARVAYVDRLERSVLVRPEGVRKLKRTNLLLTTTSSDGGATWTSPSETVPLTWRDNQNVAGDDFNSSSPQDEAVVVADSKRLTIAITGELLSQTIANIERLVRVPYGCGEQNLISLAPNVYVFRYLASRTSYFSSRGPPGAALKKRLFSNMRVGYVRQLRYKSSSDGGFSAYGEGAGWGTFEGSSLWLTAFSLRVFADVGRAGYTGTSLLAAGSNDLDRSKHMNEAPSVSIDWPNLAPAVRFILNSQSSSGDFLNRGRVFSSSMKGSTAGSRLSLTSFVTLTLCSVWRELNRDYFGSAWIEGENDTPPEHVVAAGALILVTTMRDVTRAIRRASSWVKQSRGGQSDSVSARILSLYALLRAGETASADFPAGKVLGSEAASEVLLLKKLDTEGLYYWEDGPEVDAATTSSTSSGVPGYYFRSDPNSEPSAASIELTAYAVLALVAAGDSNNAYSGVKWLLKHRSEAGGFRSTQDTVVALEAIAEFQLQMALSSASGENAGDGAGATTVLDVMHQIATSPTASSSPGGGSSSMTMSASTFRYEMTDPELWHTIPVYNESFLEWLREQNDVVGQATTTAPPSSTAESVLVSASVLPAAPAVLNSTNITSTGNSHLQRTAVVSVLQEYYVLHDSTARGNNASLLDDCFDFVAKWFNEDKSEISNATTSTPSVSSSQTQTQQAPKFYLLALRIALKQRPTPPNCIASFGAAQEEMTMLSIGLFSGTTIDARERDRLLSSSSAPSGTRSAAVSSVSSVSVSSTGTSRALSTSSGGSSTTFGIGTRIDLAELGEGCLHLYLDSLPSGDQENGHGTAGVPAPFTLSVRAREEFVVQNRQQVETKVYMYYRPDQKKQISVAFGQFGDTTSGLSYDEILAGSGGETSAGAPARACWLERTLGWLFASVFALLHFYA
eukprot:CAMPEP_0179003786 /NCGR_PEP_ID=MMETSP0795-20121207/12899_1 /TAXON_ID=88552 /ORGANISM="Amoebophrya sp., Strain Ameob2" /LENGTH=2312 /DNA_ID=CAMNT_0020697889 /DNA_START=200 /DNA_END=7138 /DNA_ORIENTATION=-